MGAKSNIEWTDATWTPIRARRHDNGKVGVHCELVSEGCKNCYAASHNKRNLPVHGTGLDFTVLNREKVEIFVDDEMLMAPIRWRKLRKIFVCSQTDLFGEFVADEMIDRVFAVMALCPQHTFQVLTKRPERMRKYIGQALHSKMVEVIGVGTGQVRSASWMTPLENVWLGVTAENQTRADERIPVLLQTPAARRFVSVEPMLGPVDFFWIRDALGMGEGGGFVDALNGWSHDGRGDGCGVNRIDWVICGGESGRGARPMHPDWARSLRDQAVAAGVPFMFKQWGAWQIGSGSNPSSDRVLLNDGMLLGMALDNVPYDVRSNWAEYRSTVVSKVGKKTAGRLLDGAEWNQFPEAGEGRA